MRPYLFILCLSFLTCAQSRRAAETSNPMAQLIQSGKPVVFEGKTFEDDIDFTTMIQLITANSQMQTGYINSPIRFSKCTFKGKVNGATVLQGGIQNIQFNSHVSFEDCYFEKEVNFRSCIFGGRTSFAGSVFVEKAIFEETAFMHPVLFNGAVFEGEFRGQNSYFMSGASFMEVQGKDIFSLQSTVSQKDLVFNVAKFYGYFDLSLARVEGSFLANYGEFHDRMLISNGHFGVRLVLASGLIKDASIKGNTVLGKFDYSPKTTIGKVEIRENTILHLFEMNTDLKAVDFEGNRSLIPK